ncbi:MAG TPA: hypothetical protein VFP86_17925 [bacterium]|nr:hypothetical protein [bacterium]
MRAVQVFAHVGPADRATEDLKHELPAVRRAGLRNGFDPHVAATVVN